MRFQNKTANTRNEVEPTNTLMVSLLIIVPSKSVYIGKHLPTHFYFLFFWPRRSDVRNSGLKDLGQAAASISHRV